ncbi:hypothetical protein ACJJTC_014893 [Scirpophaga incertulas]
MSGLTFISEYGSSSDDSEGEKITTEPAKVKLHVPNLDAVPIVHSEDHCDDSFKHEGRIRSFPHIRGNWASFVYIKYPNEEILLNVITKIEEVFYETVNDLCHRCDDFHISLSKTFILQYHLISSFTNSLKEKLSGIKCFNLEFSQLKIYCNEDNTRTFIALKVDHWSKITLSPIGQKVDQVLEDYKLPLFYEEPSFHMSIIWLHGNQKTRLLPILNKLNTLINNEISNKIGVIPVSVINCKVGNKYFQFALQ